MPKSAQCINHMEARFYSLLMRIFQYAELICIPIQKGGIPIGKPPFSSLTGIHYLCSFT